MSIWDSLIEEYNHLFTKDVSKSEKFHRCGLNYMYRKEYDKAMNCFLEGSKLNDIDCLTELAICYYKGLGTDIDYAKALYYFEEVAKFDSPKIADAKLFMALYYAKGLAGVEQSFEKARAIVDEVRVYNHPDIDIILTQIDNLERDLNNKAIDEYDRFNEVLDELSI